MLTIQQGYLVLDENSEVVDWFDTPEEAEAFINEQETNEELSEINEELAYQVNQMLDNK